MADEQVLGLYAENIVANYLRRWPGLVELAYFRERITNSTSSSISAQPASALNV